MVRLDREYKEYIDNYYTSLEQSDIDGKELYLRVLANALELAEDKQQFEELLSFGNEYVSRNTNNIKWIAQFKYGLKKVMENHKKEYNEQALVPFVEKENDPYEIYVTNDMIKVAMEALNKISPKNKEVIEKSIFEELSYREIAKQLNCGHDTVRKYIKDGIFNMKMDFPVLYYRYYNDDKWISFLEEREEAKSKKKI